jgi:hypothetical protein
MERLMRRTKIGWLDKQKIPHGFSFVAGAKRFLFLSSSVPAKSIL